MAAIIRDRRWGKRDKIREGEGRIAIRVMGFVEFSGRDKEKGKI